MSNIIKRFWRNLAYGWMSLWVVGNMLHPGSSLAKSDACARTSLCGTVSSPKES